MSEAKSVKAPDPAKKTSEIVSATSDEATVQMHELDLNCYWNDEKFGHGEKIELGSICYECSFGRWIPVDD